MSYFKSKAIILRKQKHKEKEFLYTVFSYDFWKIDVLKKYSPKEKNLDIWYDANFEIYSKSSEKLSTISNVKIISEFHAQKHDFGSIEQYLALLTDIYKKTEKNLPIYEVYDLVSILNKSPLWPETILLARVKLFQILGVLPSDHPDPVVQKVLKFCHQNNFSRVIKLKGLQKEQICLVEKLFLDIS